MNSALLVTPCTSHIENISDESIDIQPIFKVENITVAKSPLLKVYYWECFNIESLNAELLSDSQHIEHHFRFPTCQFSSKPLKVIFWLRNLNNFEYRMSLKRKQNCECVHKQTKVGFNQFRNLYQCPHRHLVNILQEQYIMGPGELLAMSVVSNYYILGIYTLSYELRVSDKRTIMLHFHIDITNFDAASSILTSSMIPVNIKEHRSMAQPIWVRNITMKNINIYFTGKNRGLRLINPCMVVPPKSVWPLIVEYIPSDFDNELSLFLRFGECLSFKCRQDNRTQIKISCKGYIEEEIENYSTPNFDYDCRDYLYVIYPNRLNFLMEVNEERTLMVAVHNYDQKCMEFKWQSYVISEYFMITFEPSNFTLKPHHSKLCVVEVKSFNKPLHFKRIPAVLEVHRILDKSTQIAKELLTEVESIDDPKWAEGSYVEHIFLHLDLKVQFPKLERVNLKEPFNKLVVSPNGVKASISNNCVTLFEKLFWEYLSKSNHMRNTSNIPTYLSYKKVLNKDTNPKKRDACKLMSKQVAFNILSFLTGEACRDISKNYRFIPTDLSDMN